MTAVLRWLAPALLAAYWVRDYLRGRRAGLRRTRREFEQLSSLRPSEYERHYNERVPTVEEELAVWGPYHRHRHAMRYDLVAGAVRDRVRPGGVVVDVGCGSMNVADRLRDLDVCYVGADFGGPHIAYAARKYHAADGRLRARFLRGDAEALPLATGGTDMVVCSEVIEHLRRPERAVWEIARVLRPGGSVVLTTNNAAEVPLATPLRRPLLWAERAAASRLPAVLSYRAWVWPQPVDAELTGGRTAFVPHTHHIAAETLRLLASVGLEASSCSSFEFPPPHSRTARLLERLGRPGLSLADAIERVARATPVLRRMGTHLFVIAERTRASLPAAPPRDAWPGPFSGGGELSRLERARWPRRPRPARRG